MTAKALRDIAVRYRNWATLLLVLFGIGAIALGWIAGQEVECSGFSCEETTNGGVVVVVAIGSFLGSIAFVLPVFAAAHIMEGVAPLLPEGEPVAAISVACQAGAHSTCDLQGCACGCHQPVEH